MGSCSKLFVCVCFRSSIATNFQHPPTNLHPPFQQLASFVHTLLGQDDVRSSVRDRFRLQTLVEQSQLPPGWA